MRKLFAVIMLCALGMASNGAAQARANGPKAKRVVLITIDGFRIEMLRDKDMPSPVLKEMAAEGVLAERVVSVAPAITYPNHTALVTGARAARHGIFYNSPFEWGNSTGVANWYADSIKSPTIWEVAKKNGLTTCSLFWPVTVGASYIDYNIPEVWSKEEGVTLRDVLCSHSTPRGIMEELEDERILIREVGSGTRAIFEDALRRHNRTLRSFPKVSAISDFSTIKALVVDGLGVSFLYAPVVERELAQGTLARFDLADTPMSGAFYFACLKDNLFARTWADWLE